MSVKVFLSTVSDEFRPYRDQLRVDLTRHNVEVKVQEDFRDLGGDTLDKLDVYIAHCDAVIHLVGDMTGSTPGDREQRALLAKYLDLADELPPLGEALKNCVSISYTQWEAWLALYHRKLLLTAKAEEVATRAAKYAPTPESRTAQIQHLARLEAVKRYPGCAFASPADLAKHIAYTAILDLLAKDRAQAQARTQKRNVFDKRRLARPKCLMTLSEICGALDGARWWGQLDEYQNRHFEEFAECVAFSRNLIDGINKSRSASQQHNNKTLQGAFQALLGLYSVAKDINSMPALSQIKQIDYSRFSTSWKKYEEDSFTLQQFICQYPLAKWVYGQAVLYMTKGNNEKRSLFEGALRGLFIAACE